MPFFSSGLPGQGGLFGGGGLPGMGGPASSAFSMPQLDPMMLAMLLRLQNAGIGGMGMGGQSGGMAPQMPQTQAPVGPQFNLGNLPPMPGAAMPPGAGAAPPQNAGIGGLTGPLAQLLMASQFRLPGQQQPIGLRGLFGMGS